MRIGEVMTDDNRQRVLSREARERLAQLERQFPDPSTERGILEQRKVKWREEEEDSEKHLQYRETDSMRARRRQAESDAAWNSWFDSRLDNRLADERDVIVEIVGSALGQVMGDLRDEMDEARKEAGQALSDEVRKLRTELSELSTVLSQLQRALAAERAKVLDLPPLPLAVRRVS
jgi:hypothetical protein